MTDMRILLVDCNDKDINEFRYMFDQIEGANVVDVECDINEVMALLSKNKYTAIVTDINANCYKIDEMMSIFKGCSPNTPLILLTNEDDDNISTACVKWGVFHYLHKFEFSVSTLRRVLLMAKELGKYKCECRIDSLLPKFDELKLRMDNTRRITDERIATRG